MLLHPERPRLVLILTVAVSVLLFACSGGDRETAGNRTTAGEETAAPDAPAATQPAAPAQASAARPMPQPASTAPAQAAPAPSQPPSPQAQQVTFGTVPQDEASSAPRPQRPIPNAGSKKVFSNTDLKAYKAVREEFGFGEDGARAASSGGASGTGDAKKGGPGEPKDKDAQIAEATKKLADLGAELENLQKRIPSLHNPLLPRVAPLDKDVSSEDGMDNADRLAHVQQRIAEVKAEMETLKATLGDLRTGSGDDGPADDGKR